MTDIFTDAGHLINCSSLDIHLFNHYLMTEEEKILTMARIGANSKGESVQIFYSSNGWSYSHTILQVFSDGRISTSNYTDDKHKENDIKRLQLIYNNFLIWKENYSENK